MVDFSGMKWDSKAFLMGLALLGAGAIALSVARVWQPSPDLAPTSLGKLLQWLALVGLSAVAAGSVAVAVTSMSFCWRWAPRKLALAGAAFLAVAAATSGIARVFPVHTYAWVPILMPWFATIVSGTIMLLVAIARAIFSQ